MTDRYFDKFPIVTYNGVQAVDIMRRTTTLKNINKNPNVIHPYELSSYERPDQFANRYYGSPYLSWQLFLTNKMLDPWYEWYMTPKELIDYVADKYGSVEAAQDKTLFYRNDWPSADDIEVGRYDSLTERLKCYYDPVYAASQRVASYTRKREDWVVNTNEILKYTVANSAFISNEIVDIVYDLNNKGQAQVLSTSGNDLIVQHTSGTTDGVAITGSVYIKGRESGTNTLFTAVSTVAKNLYPEEVVYYRAVSYYDFEVERNEYNKSIIVLDNRFSQKMVDELTTLMKE